MDRVKELADGRIFTGAQARDLGLVDELGTLEDTIEQAAKLAGIRGEPEIIYPEKKKFSLWDLILQESLQRIFGETAVDRIARFMYLFSLPQG